MLDVAAACLCLTALLAYVNHRFIRLPTTIGVMAISLALSLAIVGLDAIGFHRRRGQHLQARGAHAPGELRQDQLEASINGNEHPFRVHHTVWRDNASAIELEKRGLTEEPRSIGAHLSGQRATTRQRVEGRIGRQEQSFTVVARVPLHRQ